MIGPKYLSLCFLLCFFLVACKTETQNKVDTKTPATKNEKNAVTKPATPKETAKKEVPKKKDATKTPENTTPPPALDKISIKDMMVSLGCPADKASDKGCTACPTKLHPDPITPNIDGKMTITPGHYSSKTKPQALLRFQGCTSRAEGETTIAVVEWKSPKTWEIVAQEGFNDNVSCIHPKTKDGRKHVLCVSDSGSQGCYSSELRLAASAITWKRTSETDVYMINDKAMPKNYTKDCNSSEEDEKGKIVSKGHEIKIKETRDLDKDGDEDVVFTWGKKTFHLVQQDKSFDVKAAP